MSSNKMYCFDANNYWICDIMDIYPLKPGMNQKKVHIKIATIMDVNSRLILRATFFDERLAGGIAELVNEAIAVYGTPKCILTDGDCYFKSRSFSAEMAALGITVKTAVRNGEGACIEQWNMFLRNYLKTELSSAKKYSKDKFHVPLDCIIQSAKEKFSLTI